MKTANIIEFHQSSIPTDKGFPLSFYVFIDENGNKEGVDKDFKILPLELLNMIFKNGNKNEEN